MGPALKTQTSTAGPSLPRETERRGARILGHTEKAPLTRRPVVRGQGTSEPPEGRWPVSLGRAPALLVCLLGAAAADSRSGPRVWETWI